MGTGTGLREAINQIDDFLRESYFLNGPMTRIG